MYIQCKGYVHTMQIFIKHSVIMPPSLRNSQDIEKVLQAFLMTFMPFSVLIFIPPFSDFSLNIDLSLFTYLKKLLLPSTENLTICEQKKVFHTNIAQANLLIGHITVNKMFHDELEKLFEQVDISSYKTLIQTVV